MANQLGRALVAALAVLCAPSLSLQAAAAGMPSLPLSPLVSPAPLCRPAHCTPQALADGAWERSHEQLRPASNLGGSSETSFTQQATNITGHLAVPMATQALAVAAAAAVGGEDYYTWVPAARGCRILEPQHLCDALAALAGEPLEMPLGDDRPALASFASASAALAPAASSATAVTRVVFLGDSITLQAKPHRSKQSRVPPRITYPMPNKTNDLATTACCLP